MHRSSDALEISDRVRIPLEELELTAMRAQSAGGQAVNKISSAIHLRFDIAASSLPTAYKERLLRLSDKRITKEGVLIIKAQQHRTQERNRAAALARLQELIRGVAVVQKRRIATKPTAGSRRRRLDDKGRRGNIKALRRSVDE
jgi:ribosome-associated protein